MQKRVILLYVLLLLSDYSWSQIDVASMKDSVISKIIEQILLFPQEKLYLQVDKPFYLSGEKVWFRAWLVDAVLHKSVLNQYVYVELINPLDSVVSRVKIRQSQGVLSGFIPLNESLPEGDYTLCAYTESMLNLGADYFFKKNIRIGSPVSATEQPDVKFKYDTGDKLTAEVSFKDVRTQRKITPDGLKIRINKQPVREVKAKVKNDTVAYFKFVLPEKSIHRVFYVENKKCGKFISIPYPQDDYDVSFFPEGGYLLEGVSCAVAFKALNSSGLPVKVTGSIVDSLGNEYAQLETAHDGMGVFSLVSKEGINYYAVCKNEQGKEKQFILPAAKKGMYSLKTETNQNKLYVSVLQSYDVKEQGELFLLLHTRGIVHYASTWDNNYNSISFDSKKFPSGVMQIILFDGNMNPLSERLVFGCNNDQAQVEFNTDLQNYKPRQLVNSKVKITNNKGMPQEGTFSLSITDDNDTKPDSAANILTTLLLTSELKGYINNPGFYFQENNQEAQHALDLLMMTNGWRRYNIPKVVNGKFKNPEFPVKHGMEITGKVRTLLMGKPVVKGQVAILSWEAGFYEETETDGDGRFIFNDFEYPDSSIFIVQALNKKGSKEVELFVDANTFPHVSRVPLLIQTEIEKRKEEEQLSKYIEKADTKYTIENGMRTIYIDDVIIRGKAPEKKEYRYSFYMPGVGSSSTILTEEQLEFSQFISVSDILNYIPFISTVEVDGQKKVLIERMKYRIDRETPNYAALILDDMIIFDYDIDNVVDPSNIERIAVLKGSQATILGGDGAGGAVVITTKKGFSAKNKSPIYNIKKVTPLGFQKPAEFYSPRYETSQQRNNGQPDLRTTIYWNPNVKILSLGEAIFDFYTADASTTYTVVIEGVTSDGIIIHSIRKISRK
jgi:hypothetical protein